MPASLRELRQRRASVTTIKKVTWAMESIAAQDHQGTTARPIGGSVCAGADQGCVGGGNVLQR